MVTNMCVRIEVGHLPKHLKINIQDLCNEFAYKSLLKTSMAGIVDDVTIMHHNSQR